MQQNKPSFTYFPAKWLACKSWDFDLFIALDPEVGYLGALSTHAFLWDTLPSDKESKNSENPGT